MTTTLTTPWNPQRPGPMPYHRYRPFDERVTVPAGDRHWPSARIERAPLWVPVDLRDGNQALAEPMDTPRKRRFFDLLVGTGFKEIEVGYPSASRTDFDFVRHLVTDGAVPDDVTPVVFTPARPELIDRTFEAVEGLPRAVVHLYIATSPVWRDVVLGRDRDEVWRTVRAAAERMARRADGSSSYVRFQFSPETFNLTEPDFVLELCDGLTELWDASPDRPVTHNLPATVEIATPNVYADQIEYLHRHLARRDSVILSVHPHNDRGTGVACAELAVLAGAQRVEGCLFGNGERTGNVDLVTLALNLYTQGVDPMLDFRDVDAVRETVEHCNRLPVHPRHPYAGDLVHTAFSGTHQDAIGKGLAHHARRAAELGVPERLAPWDVPYLPVDPADLGRSYEAVIRVNSQSGKGGVAYLLHTHAGLELPPRMRPDFARVVQEATDDSGREATPKELYELFRATYLAAGGVRLDAWSTHQEAPGVHRFVCTLATGPDERTGDYEGTGTSPLTAFADALAGAGHTVAVLGLTEQPVEDGVAVYAECRVDGGPPVWGAGRDASPLAAAVQAVLSAVNRAGLR
ncbi:MULTISPECIES: 2-isopropylmalate synthase [unclassified Streptomyces]|uniref:2-isopropylmalate synthase n=1 Tax=unclassified Streptomyces TaxID=2593676 RepID=UPI00093F82AB|nr:2-isopropylmalate synthase [Streptomyces sp. TSRI0107]OKJ85393.1 2-isopropylmalate synthase [Streptomyces sp. TSRI0107]